MPHCIYNNPTILTLCQEPNFGRSWLRLYNESKQLESLTYWWSESVIRPLRKSRIKDDCIIPWKTCHCPSKKKYIRALADSKIGQGQWPCTVVSFCCWGSSHDAPGSPVLLLFSCILYLFHVCNNGVSSQLWFVASCVRLPAGIYSLC